jgi:DNA-binding XRE family transcriptional regulator
MTNTSFRKMFDDLQKRGVDAIGEDALAYIDGLLTPEEIRESNLRVALIGEIIKARQEKGLSQRQLGELSGVKQPIIARMEKGTTSPQLDTILKILAPLGKTLAIVPLER